jgi:hypothetical protein
MYHMFMSRTYNGESDEGMKKEDTGVEKEANAELFRTGCEK